MAEMIGVEGYKSIYDMGGGLRGDRYYLNPAHIAYVRETDYRIGNTITEITMNTGYTIYTKEKWEYIQLKGNL